MPPLTCDPALKVPSETGTGDWPPVASIVIVPVFDVIFEPPPTVAFTIGFSDAVARKRLTLIAPPVSLDVLASESASECACPWMLFVAITTEPLLPIVSSTFGVPCEVEFELAIEIAPPPALLIVVTAKSCAFASTSMLEAPDVSTEETTTLTLPSSFA